MAGVLIFNPQLPIFMANSEDEDLIIFPSLELALGQMEPTEVEEGFHVILDAAGRRATLKIEQWSVFVRSWSDEPDPEDLRRRITRFLSHRSLDIDEKLAVGEYIRLGSQLIMRENHKAKWLEKPKWLRFLTCGAEPK